MKRRGITDYDTLFCDGGSPGYLERRKKRAAGCSESDAATFADP